MAIYNTTCEFEKTAEWFETYLREPSAGDGIMFQTELHIMGIVAHSELGNDAVVTSLCRSLQRVLQKKTGDFEMERVFIRFIQKEPPPTERKAHWQEFANALSAFPKTQGARSAYAMFDLMTWMKGKVQ